MYEFIVENVLEKLPAKLTPVIGATKARAYIRNWYNLARGLTDDQIDHYQFQRCIIEKTLKLNDTFNLQPSLSREIDWLVFITVHCGNVLPMRPPMNRHVPRKIEIKKQHGTIVPFRVNAKRG